MVYGNRSLTIDRTDWPVQMIEISGNVRSKFFRQISRQLTYLILSEGDYAWSQIYSMKLHSIGISFQRKSKRS